MNSQRSRLFGDSPREFIVVHPEIPEADVEMLSRRPDGDRKTVRAYLRDDRPGPSASTVT